MKRSSFINENLLDSLINENKIELVVTYLLNLIINFVDAIVVLNGQYSSWANVKTGVPQRSFLGPIFFIIFVNGLSDNLT